MGATSVLLRLDGRGPKYLQLTRALKAAIETGSIRPGSRLPSTRNLAHDLKCARNVVLVAYEQLLLEGYLVSRAGGGTFVSPEFAIDTSNGAASVGDSAEEPARLSRSGRRLTIAAEAARQVMPSRTGALVDFVYGLCEPDARVRVALRTAFARVMRDQAFNYSPPAGDHRLRRALAERLRGLRGIARGADHIVVTTGAQQALDICARLLLGPGEQVVVEDPCYAAAAAAFEASGARVLRVPVDPYGLNPGDLRSFRQSIRLVYVTPSHQFPTGSALPFRRRSELVGWARRNHSYIVEDDYDGEFCYDGGPIEALAAVDPDGPVIYCGTFSKSLFPALRLGFLSLPKSLVEPATHAKWLTDCGSSGLLQRTVTTLMETGEYDRHVRRMLKTYRARRDALLAAIGQHLGDDAVVDGGGAGLHVVVWLPRLPLNRVRDLIAACAKSGVAIYSAAPYYSARPKCAGVLLGYGVVDVARIRTGIAEFSDAYHRVLHPAANRSAAGDTSA
jgi:GntR family transcriptional regulator/MocR family aminotransferase